MPAPRIILMACGSFSPPTPMHLRMFEIARDHFQQCGSYDVIGGIISPVHDSYGKRGLVPARHRCAMVKLALQTSSWIRMSDWEVGQDEWSRTVTSLKWHQNFINNYLNDTNGTSNEIVPSWLPSSLRSRRDTVQVKLLCGADLLESFSVPGLWKDEDIEEILENHGLVVVSRSGANPDKFIFESDILTQYKKHIQIVTNWVPNEVSSTLIRRLVGRGLSVKYLLDDGVIDYILKNGLYNANTTKYILSPNQNQVVVNQNFLNDQYSKIMGSSISAPPDDFEAEMDESEISSVTTKSSVTVQLDTNRPNVFCCGNETLKLKKILSRPGQAVQIITKSPDSKRDDNASGEAKSKKLKTSSAFAV